MTVDQKCLRCRLKTISEGTHVMTGSFFTLVPETRKSPSSHCIQTVYRWKENTVRQLKKGDMSLMHCFDKWSCQSTSHKLVTS